jgi:hypothetical protein
MSQSFDAELRDAVLRAVQVLDGVQHAGLDAEAGEIWIACDPDHDRGPVQVAVRKALAQLGPDAAELEVNLVGGPIDEVRRRVRFMGIERVDEPRLTRIDVDLEWGSVVYRGTATCVKSRPIELNSTASAVVDALEELTDVQLGLRVVGVKAFRAFDSELMVASLSGNDGTRQHLVGAVVVRDDQFKAAALATLSALNRTLGNFLHTSD